MRRGIAALLLAALAPEFSPGDTFTYIDPQGRTQTVEGVLAGSGQGMHALEQSDGRMLVIPQGALRERTVSMPPEPIAARDMAARLVEQFGEENIRTLVEGQYVVGLVLAGPLPPRSETRVTGFLKQAGRFLKNVENVLTRFCHDLRIDPEPARYPLVTLIFESDRDFDAYAAEATGGLGLSAERILGFYSPLTNWLALRIGECRTFQVPLHEAVHQQVFNRGLIQRLSGVPVWFNEGIATGFENDGERINVGPNKVNATYANRLGSTNRLNWEAIVKDDTAFQGDVLAGEAYAHAWSLHWLLVTEHRSNYVRYLRCLGQIAPLEEPTADERSRLFQETFGMSIREMEDGFPRLLQAALRKQRIRTEETPAAGRSITYGDASAVELTAIQRAGGSGLTEVRGKLCNISPFRDFAYHVTVQTSGGLYAEWFLPSVGSQKSAELNEQYVTKHIPGGPGTDAQTYWVEVQSALPDSDVVTDWKTKGLPVPEWKPR
ncbi:MAG: DUF1570 domain-containing protein [Planctomycetaceae bacterium]